MQSSGRGVFSIPDGSGLLNVTAVLFAKLPEAGRSKTRLVTPTGLNPAAAARVAEALLVCTAARLRKVFSDVVLAVTPDDAAAESFPPADRLIGQGTGDLGDRLVRVAGAIEGPVAFFGMDTPDLPAGHFAAIAEALVRADAAVGPTGDGGYWTIAFQDRPLELLRRIDWGSDRVYDQTLERAAGAGLRIETLPPWTDVDHPADLARLRQRVAQEAADSDVAALARRLAEIVGDTPRS